MTINIDTTDWRWATGTIGIELEFPVHGEYAEDFLVDCGVSGIEFVDYNHDTYEDCIVIKHDGSCGINDGAGCELVSPPTRLVSLINGDGLMVKMHKAWKLLSEQYLENPKHGARCGIHIHVGVESNRDPSSDLIRLRLDRLWRAYSARSAPIMEFCGDSRDPSKSGHARRYCGAHLALSDKYGQVNASPLMSGRQNTVEFRQLGMTRSTLKPNEEPFVPNEMPTGDDLLRWAGYRPAGISMHDRQYYLENAAEMWDATQDDLRVRHERGSHAHTQHGWGDIVEWAIFVVLLTEGSCHATGWITKQRDLLGDTRPDGQPWSNFWKRPAVPYEEPSVDPVTVLVPRRHLADN